jgi:hypothetical protein
MRRTSASKALTATRAAESFFPSAVFSTRMEPRGFKIIASTGHPGQKINDGTFRATFYKLAGNGKRKKSVLRRKPGRGASNGGGDAMRAGLTFIRLAGSIESAHEQLAGLAKLIETAKAIE